MAMVKSCVNGSSFGNIKNLSAIIMWPVEEMGKNSVRPSTMAITMLSNSVINLKCNSKIKGDETSPPDNRFTGEFIVGEPWVF